MYSVSRFFSNFQSLLYALVDNYDAFGFHYFMKFKYTTEMTEHQIHNQMYDLFYLQKDSQQRKIATVNSIFLELKYK